MSGRYRPLDPDGAVIEDLTTGLHWMRCSIGQRWNGVACEGRAARLTWGEAMRQARELSFGGCADWRVPTKRELLTLVYCSSGRPKARNETGAPCQGHYERATIDHVAFPNTPSFWFWSSSSSHHSCDYAWYVNFYQGHLGDGTKDSVGSVRLVRGAK
jgi:hypothetical protein